MEELNSNDYKVLNSVIDTETNTGISKLRGRTVVELSDSTGLSTSKTRSALKKLLDKEFVAKGIKRVKSETFYITAAGINELKDITKAVDGIEIEDSVEEYQEGEE